MLSTEVYDMKGLKELYDHTLKEIATTYTTDKKGYDEPVIESL